MLDPRAWIKKYFTEASNSWFVWFIRINGMNLSIFNSRDIHSKIQFELEIAIKDLLIIRDIVNNLNGNDL